MKSLRFWLALSAFAVVAGGASANDELIKLSKDPNQWVMPTGNYANWRYSELNQINKDNAKNLRPLWTFSTGVLRGHEGGPLVIGDVMYVNTPFPNNIFALDLNKNGQILWKYEPKQDPTVIPVMCCDTVNRGVAYGDGKIIFEQADATVVALDAKTGQLAWSGKNGDPKKGETMTIFARNPDTGVAKWVFQMTPHDEWDYDGVNEMILADINVKGQPTKALVHFDRNGFGYTLNRETGALLVAEKFDPKVNWATHVDMQTGRPEVVKQYSTQAQGEDKNTKGICPAALGSKDQQPAAFSPKTGLFYVPTNHVCMDYEPFKVSYTAGQPYVGATLSMYPPQGENNLGNFIAWDPGAGKIVWSDPEPFSVWSGALATAGDVVFYGTLEGYLKAVDIQTGKELYPFKTPSGISGSVNTYSHGGKQYIAVLSGVGGWAGIGMAAGLTKDTDGLGAVGAYKALANYTQLGGVLTVFGLPE